MNNEFISKAQYSSLLSITIIQIFMFLMNPEEIIDQVEKLMDFKNIIIKFGRYIPDRPSKFDEVLGVTLASDNQYAERIS